MTSLLDPDTGDLYIDTPAQRAALLARARLSEVERELRAQIDAVVDAGLAPTHLDWHCLADGGRADIFDLGMALAKEYGLAARVWLEDGRRKARKQGKPVVDNTFVDSFSVSLDQKAATYARMLHDLPPGLNEWALHPAHGVEQWQGIEPSGWHAGRNAETFGGIAFSITLSLLLLSGVLLRMSLAPRWLQMARAFNPLSYAVDAAREVFDNRPGDASIIKGFTVIGLFAALSLVGAVRSFSRDLS